MMVPLDPLDAQPLLPLHPEGVPAPAAPALDAGEAVVGGAAGDAAEEIAGEEDERAHLRAPFRAALAAGGAYSALVPVAFHRGTTPRMASLICRGVHVEGQ